MKNEGRLTGPQAEAWFKQFAEKAYMLSKLEYSTVSLARLLEKELSHRLTNARMFIYGSIPKGDEWLNEILSGKAPAIFSEVDKEELSAYLLDRVVATDVLDIFKNSNEPLQKVFRLFHEIDTSNIFLRKIRHFTDF
jgi:hypothetical protein